MLPQTEFEFNSLTFSNNSFISFSGDGSFIYFGTGLPQFQMGGAFAQPCLTVPSTTTPTKPVTTSPKPKTTTSTSTHTTSSNLKHSPTAAASSSSGAGAAIGAAIAAVGGVILVVILVVVLLKRRNRPSAPRMGSTRVSESSLDAAEVKPAHVNVKEAISQSFAGTVYHGEFKDGPNKMSVAVRMPLQGASKDVRKQFLKEIALVRRVGLHPYIVECAPGLALPVVTLLAASLASARAPSRTCCCSSSAPMVGRQHSRPPSLRRRQSARLPAQVPPRGRRSAAAEHGGPAHLCTAHCQRHGLPRVQASCARRPLCPHRARD